MMHDAIIQARNICKVYPGIQALDHVDYTVYRSKVNVLIGENGAGKSTMMKILAGVENKTSGTLLLNDSSVEFHSTKDAEQHGISIIFQELNLFPNLTVAENIFIGREFFEKGRINTKKQAQAAKEILQRLSLDIDPNCPLGELGIGQQQLVEIARALSKESHILIMDEPTSALSQLEVRTLFKVIADLKARGVTIIYISHRLEELIEIGDHITVLRDGRFIAEALIKEISLPWIIDKMVGKDRKKFLHTPAAPGKEVLTLHNVTLPKEQGGYWVNNVSFSLRQGEIIGIYGLLGAGRSELFKVIMGALPIYNGAVILDQTCITQYSYRERLHCGLTLVPEDRKKEGIISLMSIQNNLTLSQIAKGSLMDWFRPISTLKDYAHTKTMQEKLSIKINNRHLPITSLSGGNQQKIVLGKMLLMNPKVILLDEPTRGIDVGAKADVYQLISDLAHQGLAVIFSSSELEEVMSVADRILIMADGHLAADFTRQEATQDKIIRASTPSNAQQKVSP